MSTRLRQRGAHVGLRLVAAERAFNAELVGALHDRGFGDIRPSHGAVFANIDAEGTRPTELARRADMTKQSMGELLSDLEAKGYVERRPDPADRRASLVVLTKRGRRVDGVADEAIAHIESEYARRLGRERFDRLVELLAELAGPVG